jgi:terminase small subunit / prophage DNA-packing protein
MATQDEIAGRLGLNPINVSRYIKAGIITAKPRGQYDLDEVTLEFINHLRDRASGRSADLSEERARLAKEQADGKEMENAVTRGELVYIDDVANRLESALIRVRIRLLSIPTDIAPEVVSAGSVIEAQEIISRAILGALNELAGIDEGEAGGATH